MEIKTYKCDICGEKIKDWVVGKNRIQFDGYGICGTGGFLENCESKYDLCDKHIKELVKFLNKKRKGESGEEKV